MAAVPQRRIAAVDRAVSSWVFVAGYLLTWTAFGLLAYGLSEGGTELSTLRVLDVDEPIAYCLPGLRHLDFDAVAHIALVRIDGRGARFDVGDRAVRDQHVVR